jgi:hypothetical protein
MPARPGGGGADLSAARSSTDSPSAGANAATYTSPATLGCRPISVMTTPPHEWPTSSTGPPWRSMARRTAPTSSASDVSGVCTATTFKPCASSKGMTAFQLDASAQAPWTRTTDGGPPAAGDAARTPGAAHA